VPVSEVNEVLKLALEKFPPTAIATSKKSGEKAKEVEIAKKPVKPKK